MYTILSRVDKKYQQILQIRSFDSTVQIVGTQSLVQRMGSCRCRRSMHTGTTRRMRSCQWHMCGCGVAVWHSTMHPHAVEAREVRVAVVARHLQGHVAKNRLSYAKSSAAVGRERIHGGPRVRLCLRLVSLHVLLRQQESLRAGPRDVILETSQQHATHVQHSCSVSRAFAFALASRHSCCGVVAACCMPTFCSCWCVMARQGITVSSVSVQTERARCSAVEARQVRRQHGGRSSRCRAACETGSTRGCGSVQRNG